ncbi:pantetheinase-like [Mytilus californianus]|uniref:pantetheinase-like n=1 Tax=Mytilus californianus TaxID=6549 RepID=UPI002245CDD1|nr:pantetheinase-like [Mytilus californianus]
MCIINNVVFCSILYIVVNSESSTFRAAVYEHAVIIPTERKAWVHRSTALENMMKNFEIYKVQAEIANKQNVNILVFPEDGLYGMGFSRTGLESYLEYIPDPNEKWNACNFPDKYENTEIQRKLSCIAKDNSLYLVVNMGDHQSCNSTNDTKCPQDGHYQFNTDIVYNPKGELIAKYHKINLFYEKQFDTPPVSELVTFDTPFGKFAMFTCFDILFKIPAIDSLKVQGVGNVVFPTAWMDALPLLAAIQFHSAFAAGAKVNFLAANINLPSFKFHGSGIYSPEGYGAFYYSEKHGGKLLIANLSVVQNGNFITKDIYRRPKYDLESKNESSQFYSHVFHDLFTFVSLTNATGNISVCNGKLCCHLKYERSNGGSENYAFGAFDGLHTYEGVYYIQVCTLLKCKSSSKDSCGKPVKTAYTRFTNLKMTGTFGTPYIFPEILLTDNGTLKLSSGNLWSYDRGTLQSERGFELPVISVGMFARDYLLDADIQPVGDYGTNIAFCCKPSIIVTIFVYILSCSFLFVV